VAEEEEAAAEEVAVAAAWRRPAPEPPAGKRRGRSTTSPRASLVCEKAWTTPSLASQQSAVSTSRCTKQAQSVWHARTAPYVLPVHTCTRWMTTVNRWAGIYAWMDGWMRRRARGGRHAGRSSKIVRGRWRYSKL
jgi:hypothetical protein